VRTDRRCGSHPPCLKMLQMLRSRYTKAKALRPAKETEREKGSPRQEAYLNEQQRKNTVNVREQGLKAFRPQDGLLAIDNLSLQHRSKLKWGHDSTSVLQWKEKQCCCRGSNALHRVGRGACTPHIMRSGWREHGL